MLYKCSKESKDTEDEIGCIQGGVAIDTAVQWLRFRASIVEDLGSIPGWEDPLKEEIATSSSVLAGKVLWTEEPGEL